jgi:hypothetical protein
MQELQLSLKVMTMDLPQTNWLYGALTNRQQAKEIPASVGPKASPLYSKLTTATKHK